MFFFIQDSIQCLFQQCLEAMQIITSLDKCTCNELENNPNDIWERWYMKKYVAWFVGRLVSNMVNNFKEISLKIYIWCLTPLPPPRSVRSEKCLATRMMMMMIRTVVKVAAGLMTGSSALSTPQSEKRLRGPETYYSNHRPEHCREHHAKISEHIGKIKRFCINHHIFIFKKKKLNRQLETYPCYLFGCTQEWLHSTYILL